MITEELQAILERMKECDQNFDQEVAHSDGDTLLIEVIRLLANNQYPLSPDNAKAVKDIISLWEHMGKWYA